MDTSTRTDPPAVEPGPGSVRPVALVTGGSRGLGRALVAGLLADGWAVVTDGRDPARLAATATDLTGAEAAPDPSGTSSAPAEVVAPEPTPLTAIAGDVGDPGHRADLLAAVDAAGTRGRLDLLVLNAGDLGPSPLPRIGELDPVDLATVLVANVVAPHAVVRDALPRLRTAGGSIVAITSDAASEAYEGWGAYGASKAALEHLARVLAEEEPAVAVHRIDPGDLRTDMHQAAFPGEDISDRADPASAVPGILGVVHRRPPSGGRWRAQDEPPRPATSRTSASTDPTDGEAADPTAPAPEGAVA